MTPSIGRARPETQGTLPTSADNPFHVIAVLQSLDPGTQEICMLGSLGKTDWLDVSDYVVHFAKGDDDTGYKTMMSILWNRVLLRGPEPFGIARKELGDSQRAVCFSEAPLGFLQRLVARRGTRHGIGFKKRFVLDKGGGPIWYQEFGTPQHMATRQLIDEGLARGPLVDDPLWKLTPFIDVPSGPSAPYTYDFRWEREWRIAADMRFVETDVAFLLVPEHLHEAARSFFEDHAQANTGPAYLCPYFDPTWPVERVKSALAGGQ